MSTKEIEVRGEKEGTEDMKEEKEVMEEEEEGEEVEEGDKDQITIMRKDNVLMITRNIIEMSRRVMKT